MAQAEKINLMSWNVNGIRAVYRKEALTPVFAEKPDVLCLQETKAMKEQLSEDLINIDGYHSYFVSAVRKGYSGVAIYSRKEPVKIENGLGIEKFDEEGRTIIAHFDKFSLFNIYYPNGKASKERLKYKLDFYDAFLEKAVGLKEAGKGIIICGDVNTAHTEIDLARPKENEKVSGFLPEERAWIDKFIEAGFVDTFRLFNQEEGNYTWWDMKSRARDRNIGWRIDYFFVSDNLEKSVKKATIRQDFFGSDHCPIGLEVAL